MKYIYTLKGDAYSMVDDIDYPYLSLFNWNRDHKGYFVSRTGDLRGKRLNRIIAERMGLKIIGLLVDHKDRNRINNCRDNLRVANNGQNRANSVNINQTGYKGVVFRIPCKLRPSRKGRRKEYKPRWMAQITVNNKKIYLGNFDSPEKAHAAYVSASIEYFGEFSNTGFKNEKEN